jgi:hypothetical protein
MARASRQGAVLADGPLNRGAHLLGRLAGIQAAPPGLHSERGETVADPLQKRFTAGLDPVGRALTAPAQRLSQRQLQQQGEIRLQSTGGDRRQLLDQIERQTAAVALIRRGGAAEAIAQHPVASRQGRFDPLLHVLSPIGRIEQQLGGAAGSGVAGGMQQQRAQGLAEGGATGLARQHQLSPSRQQAAGGQPGAQPFELGGLATAVDPLQHQKATALSHHAPAAGRSPPR